MVEALIGGIYLDGGLETARAFVLRNWSRHIAENRAVSKDAKTYPAGMGAGAGRFRSRITKYSSAKDWSIVRCSWWN